MKIGFQNPNFIFGERLRYLFSNAGYDVSKKGWRIQVAKAFFALGIVKYQSENLKGKENNNLARQIHSHCSMKDGKVPETVWICRYCQFFCCSADYLLGIIDRPTHEHEDIGSVTGLSDCAIDEIMNMSDIETMVLDVFLKKKEDKALSQAISDFFANLGKSNDWHGASESFKNGASLFILKEQAGEVFNRIAHDKDITNYYLRKKATDSWKDFIHVLEDSDNKRLLENIASGEIKKINNTDYYNDMTHNT